MATINLQQLEIQINALINQCHQLAQENQLLKHERTQLLVERDTLLEKNTLARSRLEEMIARLKTLEIGNLDES